MSWKDRKSTIDVGEGPSYPFIQFVHNGGSLEPRLEQGAFAMTLEQTDVLDAVPVGATPHTLHFRGGDAERVAVTQRITLAPLTTRFAWIKDQHRMGTYVKGARGKLQLLAYVLSTPLDEERAGEILYAGPVMLTFTGLASKQVSDALKAHRKQVRKATRGQAPSVLFTLTLGVEEPRLAGATQQSRITPIVLVEEGAFDPDQRYVGDALADIIEQDWSEYEAWSQAWQNPGPNGDGEIHEEDDEGEVETAPAAPAAPAPNFNVALPFKSTKYPGGTVHSLVEARDLASIQALIGWAESKQHPILKVARQAQTAVKASANDDYAPPF
jgi:hypothetical protein